MNKTFNTSLYLILAFALTSTICLGQVNPRNRKLQQLCGGAEIQCWSDARQEFFCHPSDTNCPLECGADQVLCSNSWDNNGVTETHEYCHWGVNCPLTCNTDEVHCHDPNTMVESCHPMDQGCPLYCSPDQVLCSDSWDNNGVMETHEYCHYGTNCPLQCDHNTQVLCHDPTTMIESCHPIGQGCPVTCGADQVVCYNSYEVAGTIHTNEYCHFGTVCPIQCDWNTQVSCHDPNTMVESCHPIDQGCPLFCSPDQVLCSDSWDNNGVMETHEYCHYGTNCPVQCDTTFQQHCWNQITEQDECHSIEVMCPVHCQGDEIKCTKGPDFHSSPEIQVHEWCISGDMECPLDCGVNAISCWDMEHDQEYCHTVAAGSEFPLCPTTCAVGSQLCSHPADPNVEGSMPAEWCIGNNDTCPPPPVYCPETEQRCWNELTQHDECHPAGSMCPVYCATGSKKCFGPGVEWCIGGDLECPLSCGVNQIQCHDTTTGNDFCHEGAICPAHVDSCADFHAMNGGALTYVDGEGFTVMVEALVQACHAGQLKVKDFQQMSIYYVPHGQQPAAGYMDGNGIWIIKAVADGSELLRDVFNGSMDFLDNDLYHNAAYDSLKKEFVKKAIRMVLDNGETMSLEMSNDVIGGVSKILAQIDGDHVRNEMNNLARRFLEELLNSEILA